MLEWAAHWASSTPRGRQLVAPCRRPTPIPDPKDDPDGRLTEDGRLAGHGLRRLVAGDLAGLFDGPSTVRFDPSLPMVSLDLTQVTENSTLILVLMTCASAWMESALLDPDGGQRWVIYDEAWRLMSVLPTLGTGQGLWRIKDRSFVLRHQHHQAELELFKTPAPAAGRY